MSNAALIFESEQNKKIKFTAKSMEICIDDTYTSSMSYIVIVVHVLSLTNQR